MPNYNIMITEENDEFLERIAEASSMSVEDILHRLNCTDTIFVTILRCYNRATDMSPTPDAYSF